MMWAVVKSFDTPKTLEMSCSKGVSHLRQKKCDRIQHGSTVGLRFWGNSDLNISKLPSRTSVDVPRICHCHRKPRSRTPPRPQQGHSFFLLWVASGVACSLNLRSTKQPGLGMASEYQPWYGLVWKYITPQILMVDHLVCYWMSSLEGISYLWTNPFAGKRSQNVSFSIVPSCSITWFEHVRNLIFSYEKCKDI